MREHKGALEGLKMAYIGDGNNMANSLIVGCLKVGMGVSIACPADYRPDPAVLEFAKGCGDRFTLTEDCAAAAKDADVIFTDVWASMGQEGEAEKRRIAFAGYQVNAELLSRPPGRTAWCSTACPPTAARRSPPKCSRRMPMRSSTRRRTASTPRRRSWSPLMK